MISISDIPTLSPSILLLAEYIFCGIFILAARRFFGLHGLYIYSAVGVIAANLVVLKTTFFPYYDSPLALGTVVFSSLFLCSDMINEYYGKAAAVKGIWVGFFAYFVLSTFIFLNMGYVSADGGQAQQAMRHLFLPAPAIFISSLVAYFLGQYTDVFLYHVIHKKTGERLLWVRSLVSTFLAMLIDNAVFSLLAWHFFALNPLSFTEIFWTYIWGVSILRFIISFGNIGMMYLSKFLSRHQKAHVQSLF
ncbi:MAG: queuosine precursor transporter [Holosporaceae bacterium]|nr:MAG: queuosine precursor transporter [Holosporaceae bacterium]